ncbi:MAG: 4-hydroxythreonine-4-phosphate dehydrogenase [bacterium P3]|nr:MAG: 4-hydroxythreonine-4-phosphate dehydrogenase [bacterium P3]KWW41821.1 MAG: 4-hydroxythreonine-4-phosphate dehydrogenase [bacterium F083]
MTSRNTTRVAISHGDINGVAYEVILKTFSDARMFEFCTPVLYGSSNVASYHKKLLSLHQDVSFNVIHSASEAAERKFNIVNLTAEEVKIELGKSTEIAGALAREALNKACDDLKQQAVDVLVTAPINKKNIQASDFDFPGHTEYLSHQFGCSSLMMMVCDRIRIGIVTNHLALRDVPGAITHNLLFDKMMLMNESLKRDFGIPMPKIAVLALDPHAGDNGVIGDFDMKVVKPVIDEVQGKGVLAYGPFPSDGFFGSSSFNRFDGVLALYHDQGLIPFKLMSFTEGVNFTAGLPYVRTSPAHGTAYDIAGHDKASEQSFRSAVYLACNILRNRREYDELTSNPLN